MNYGCGFVIAYFVVWVLVELIAEVMFGRAGAVCVRGLTILFGFAVMPGILRDIRRRKQLRAPSAKEVLAKDKRPPIVYLRSFKEEGTRKDLPALLTVEPLMNPLGFGGRILPTFEEDLAAYVESTGPFVTLSDPKYGPPELGAARVPTKENGNWWDELEDLLNKCRLVIFRAGETESLLEELKKLVKDVPATKVLVYLQIGIEHDAGVQRARYNKFRKVTQSICKYPENAGH